MLFKGLWKITLLSLLAALASCSKTTISSPSASPSPSTAPTASISTSSATETLVIGDISDEPAKKIRRYQPLADYLAAQLQNAGFATVQVKIAPNMETMSQWLKSGEVDLYFDSPFPALIVSEQSGAQPILRRWKDGVAEYKTVIFTLTKNDIKSLNDLQGHLIAFEEPFSTSGYMLPLAHLVKAGLKLVEKPNPVSTVGDDEVGYVFSKDDKNAIQWVLGDRVTAAAVSAPDYLKISEKVRAQLTILAETEALPRHLTLVSTTLSPKQKTAIKTTLLQMDNTETGRAVLKQFEETKQFDEFPEGANAGLARMQALYDLTQKN